MAKSVIIDHTKHNTKIIIDGKEIHDVTGYKISAKPGSPPVLTIKLLILDDEVIQYNEQ